MTRNDLQRRVGSSWEGQRFTRLEMRWRYVPPTNPHDPPDVWTDRGVLMGATGTGKSTLGERYMDRALRRYPTLRTLVLDSKPRFRGMWEVNGLTAAARYARWAHGAAVIPESVALPVKEPAEGLRDAFRFGSRVAIAQAPNGAEDHLQIQGLLRAASAFFDIARADQPSLLYVDEVMDFFHANGSPVGRRNTLVQCARAGRELGLGLLFATQRPRGIPAQLLQEANFMDLFYLRNSDDVDRIDDFGPPQPETEELMPSQNDKSFFHFDHERPSTMGVYRLVLG